MKLSLGLTPRDYSVAGGVTYDADAQSYFTANTAITSSADKNAINTFYLGLKTDGIYSLLNGMHLPIWQNASNNKWNLINPVDTDAGYRLTYATGMLHEVNGIRGNGTSAYANTYFLPSTNNYDNQSFGAYCTIDNNNSGVIMGVNISTAGSPATNMQPRNSTNAFRQQMSSTTVGSVANSSSLGFFQIVRTSGTSIFNVKNSTVTTVSLTGTDIINKNLYYLAQNVNDTSVINYSTKRVAFSYFGQALTTTQATNFYNRVQTLMTYFGIQV